MSQHFSIRLPHWQKNKSVKLKDRISTNEMYRIHPHVMKKVNDAFFAEVAVAVRKYKIKPVKVYPVEFRFAFCLTGRLLDWDNTSAMAKEIIDGLRYAGILKDDSPSYCKGGYLGIEKSEHGFSFCNVEIVSPRSP